MFNPFSPLVDLIWDGVMNVFQKIYSNLLDVFGSLVVSFTAESLNILNSDYVVQTTIYIQGIALSLLALKALADCLIKYILFQNGESIDAGGFLIRIAASVAVITSVPWIIRTIYTFGTSLAMEIVDVRTLQGGEFSLFKSLENPAITVLIAGIAGMVLFVLVVVQSYIRAVELAVLSVIGPGMAVGLLNTDGGLFSIWWKELLVISMSQVIQIFLLKGSLACMGLLNSPISNVITLIAWLWVAYKTPTVLRQYAYSSGVGGAAGNVAQQAGSMYILRRAVLKGA